MGNRQLSTWDIMAYENRRDELLNMTPAKRQSRFNMKLETALKWVECQGKLNESMRLDYQKRRVHLDTIGSPFAIGGRAAVLQETLAKALKKIYQQRVTKSARIAAGFKIDYYDRFFDLTLAFRGNRLVIVYPMIEAGEIVRVCYPVPVEAKIEIPFSVRVDLTTLRDVVNLCDAGRIDIEYRHFIDRLALKQSRNRARLVTYADPLEHLYKL